MINLSLKRFFTLLFSIIGVTYITTFVYSIAANFQGATTQELGRVAGYNMGYMTYYLQIAVIVFTAFFLLNLLVSKIRLAKNS